MFCSAPQSPPAVTCSPKHSALIFFPSHLTSVFPVRLLVYIPASGQPLGEPKRRSLVCVPWVQVLHGKIPFHIGRDPVPFIERHAAPGTGSAIRRQSIFSHSLCRLPQLQRAISPKGKV
jgi:hypothetical protein